METKNEEKGITGSKALQWAAAYLIDAGVDQKTAYLEGRLLLGKAWNKKGIKLIISLEEILDVGTRVEYRDMIMRRAENEPLQYILGEQEFMGLPFVVTPAVLIPRFDTEVLVSEALTQGKEYDSPLVLDLGTGSGAIALSLAYFLPKAQVIAVDISPEALNVARENSKQLGVVDRVRFICGDMFSPLNKDDRFNLIVSNPPYISEEEFTTLAPEVKKEPYHALYGGIDGLDYYRHISVKAPEYMVKGGHLLMEIGWRQGQLVSELLKENSFSNVRILKDYNGNDRVVIGQK